MYVVQFSRSLIKEVTESLIVSTIRNDSTIIKAIHAVLQDPTILEWIKCSPEMAELFCTKATLEIQEFPNQSVFYFPVAHEKIGLSIFHACNGHIF